METRTQHELREESVDELICARRILLQYYPRVLDIPHFDQAMALAEEWARPIKNDSRVIDSSLVVTSLFAVIMDNMTQLRMDDLVPMLQYSAFIIDRIYSHMWHSATDRIEDVQKFCDEIWECICPMTWFIRAICVRENRIDRAQILTATLRSFLRFNRRETCWFTESSSDCLRTLSFELANLTHVIASHREDLSKCDNDCRYLAKFVRDCDFWALQEHVSPHSDARCALIRAKYISRVPIGIIGQLVEILHSRIRDASVSKRKLRALDYNIEVCIILRFIDVLRQYVRYCPRYFPYRTCIHTFMEHTGLAKICARSPAQKIKVIRELMEMDREEP